MLVQDLLAKAAQRTPDAVAVLDARATATYAELEALSNRFANVCLRHGVQPRDRVVLALENSINFVAAYFGVMKTGATVVPVPPGPRSDRLAAALTSCAPTLCITDRATAVAALPGSALASDRWLVSNSSHNHRHVEARIPAASLDLEAALANAPEVVRIVVIGEDSQAAIVFTSGSTGTPRGVMLTHRNIVANTRSIAAYLALTACDRIMCVLPLYYVYGLSLLHTHMMVGGSIVLDNRFAYPNVVLRTMHERHVTGLAGVPSTFALLLHRSDIRSALFPDLRYVTQAGGRMPRAHVLEWLAQGPQVPFYVMYGATEAAARLTYLSPSELPRKVGSIGKPIPGVEIDVVTDDGRRTRPREIGELVARGENISPGYWNDPEETNLRFRRDGYHTGDLGYADEEGFLFLVGRRHEMLKVGAHRVGPREIEDVLHQHPAVHEAAVVGAPSDLLGEVPVAFATLRDPGSEVNEQAIRAFCAARLPSHKVPVRIVLSRDLPLRPGGKIDRIALRTRARSIPYSGGVHERYDAGGPRHAGADGPAFHHRQLSVRR